MDKKVNQAYPEGVPAHPKSESVPQLTGLLTWFVITKVTHSYYYKGIKVGWGEGGKEKKKKKAL